MAKSRKAARNKRGVSRVKRMTKRAASGRTRGGALHSTRVPGESAAYRAARNALLRAEMVLRRQIEKTAAQRRTLPLGGEAPEDYAFVDMDGRSVRLSELFEDGKEALIIYSFMYGPAMKEACPSCTSILDSVDGASPHARQRVNLVVVARSPAERIRAHAEARGWRHLKLLSSASNNYNRDFHAEDESGAQWPILNVFVRRGGRIRHFYATELLFAPAEPGQEPRHVDAIWPIWNLFDLTPGGRGKDWNPQLVY
jgi:predicted dithiol-disulfide oxidoreductase (DUF899 family)